LGPAATFIHRQTQKGGLNENQEIHKNPLAYTGCSLPYGVFLSPWKQRVYNGRQGKKKRVEHVKSFQIYQKKCLGCHDSVADPEKPGKTRDDWNMVVNVMHKYGFDMTPKEGEAITDLLYDLRKGIEKEAG